MGKIHSRFAISRIHLVTPHDISQSYDSYLEYTDKNIPEDFLEAGLRLVVNFPCEAAFNVSVISSP